MYVTGQQNFVMVYAYAFKLFYRHIYSFIIAIKSIHTYSHSITIFIFSSLYGLRTHTYSARECNAVKFLFSNSFLDVNF